MQLLISVSQGRWWAASWARKPKEHFWCLCVCHVWASSVGHVRHRISPIERELTGRRWQQQQKKKENKSNWTRLLVHRRPTDSIQSRKGWGNRKEKSNVYPVDTMMIIWSSRFKNDDASINWKGEGIFDDAYRVNSLDSIESVAFPTGLQPKSDEYTPNSRFLFLFFPVHPGEKKRIVKYLSNIYTSTERRALRQEDIIQSFYLSFLLIYMFSFSKPLAV